MLQYLILILFVLTTLGQGVNLYQQQPTLIQPSPAQAALLAQSSNAALMTSQASSTIQAASLAAATTASIASALTGSSGLQSYPYQVNSDSFLEWNQFAILAWELNNNANFDLWASKQFNNAWIGDFGMISPVQMQLPSWVDASSQSQWNVWAQILCAQRNLNSLNMGNDLGAANAAQLLQNGLGLSNNANGLLASSLSNNVNGLLASSLSNGPNGILASGPVIGGNNLLASSLANGANGLLASGLANSGLLASNWNPSINGNAFAYNGVFVGSQPSGTGPWSGHYSGWTQNNGVWYGDNGLGWFQDSNGDWYKMSSNSNSFGAGSVNGVLIGPQPTGSGPWNGQYSGWTQNNDWWYQNNNKGVGWYMDNANNWYMNNQYSANGYNRGVSSGNGVYVGPQPSGSGPWSGQVNGWSQRNGRWYNSNGASWYKDNQGNWYTSNNNGNTGSGYQGNWNNNNGVYVGPQPSGSGPWNGQFTGWNQNNGVWYNDNNGNGNGWYKDNQGNWYTSNSNANFGSGFQGNWNNNNGVYVGPQPSGSGPWNGQYTGWNQNNGVWYNGNNGNGNGWYKDNQGNWYTSNSNANVGFGYQSNWYNNNGNNGNNGVYVGPQPSGSGPWNGQYTGWNQNNNMWYNRNGVGWYQDNTGNWYTSNNGNNGITGSGIGNRIYVGPQPTGLGPWNGQYTGWTQSNGMWYDRNGVSWYQDNQGNWYTSSANQMTNGIGEGQGIVLGSTSSQCVATTVGQMNATLTCPPSTVIVSVLGAAYGNTPGSCPSNVNTMNPTCTLNVTQLIQKSCQGQNMCSVTVQPNILGAPTNNGQQCSTATNSGPYAATNQYTLVARYTCGIAGPGGIGIGGLNSTSLTFTPPNSASSASYAASLILASILAAIFSIL